MTFSPPREYAIKSIILETFILKSLVLKNSISIYAYTYMDESIPQIWGRHTFLSAALSSVASSLLLRRMEAEFCILIFNFPSA